jgi:hypothetical protein
MNDSRCFKAKVATSTSLAITAFICLLCMPSHCLASACLAYVGPGSGITLLWTLLAVLGGILFMVFGLLLWPVRLLLRAIKRKKSKNETESTPNLNTENSNNTKDDKQTLPSS